jgi:hypothetical protein
MNLSKPGNYAHSQSDAGKSRDNKARSSLYAALRKFSLLQQANQDGAGFSLILKQDEVVFIASQRVLRLSQRIDMVQFRPRRGLASAQNLLQGKNLPLGRRPATHALPTWKVSCVRL